ncbi:PEP/pyruvate-binding domain-containing protein [Streptomyces sp. NPDC006733]|uniref:PEP/pyruvate-binding domain-containing protein n=1 Tax=Streptomyces sp. NPDC006733 TaxID=3155460 RepID=UPI0033EE3ED0
MPDVLATAPLTAGPALGDPGQVGNKFARLRALRHEGFPVPDFFCLPAPAFDEALAALRPLLPPTPAPAAGEPAAADWCAAARRALAGSTVAAELAARTASAFDDLVGAGGTAAVRACVVPAEAGGIGEDSAQDPFAGMSDSFLYVPRRDLLAAVVRCWASAFNPEAVRYRLWRGLDPAGARVAVGIQRMVPGTRSFVAFTRDPRDGARRHLIAAAHGIGEGVVQEKADVDHFFVDLDDRRVTARTVHKRWSVGRPDGTSAGDPVLLPVPDALAAAPVLDDGQALAVAALAARVERFLGGPQDIEGTITPDGAVHLVQARPMVLPSAAPPAPAPAPAPVSAPESDPSRVFWGNHNITESYPGISGALTYSLAQEFYRCSFTDLYRRMGVSRRQLHDSADRLRRMVGFLDGRVYYRIDDWHALHGRMPAFELVRRPWEEAMGITGAARAPRRWSRPRVALAVPGLLLRAALHPWHVHRFLRWWDGQTAEAAATGDTPGELIALHRRVWARASTRWGVTLVNSILLLAVLRCGTALLRRWTGEGPQVFAALLSGGRENRSLAAVRAAIALAEEIGALPELRAAVGSGDPREVWQDVTAGRHGAPVAASALAYLRRYGDRALHDLKLDEPTPRQRPWMVLDLVRPLIRQGATVAANRADERAAAARSRTRLRAVCPGPVRRAVLLLLAAATRRLVRVREDTRFCRTQLFGLSREVLWRLGAELARTGVLDDPLDVVDLTVDEVIGAFDGTLVCTDLRSTAALRRAARERRTRAAHLPALLSTVAGRPLGAALRDAVAVEPDEPAGGSGDGSVLHGLGSSGGVVRGRARVLLDPAAAQGTDRGGPDAADGSAADGRILVARETDPGWLFLMTAAKGLVVERGTLLSHTAITGRLLGVPTVVAVAGATALIPDGAWIEIDGGAGTVRLLPDPTDRAPRDD